VEKTSTFGDNTDCIVRVVCIGRVKDVVVDGPFITRPDFKGVCKF